MSWAWSEPLPVPLLLPFPSTSPSFSGYSPSRLCARAHTRDPMESSCPTLGVKKPDVPRISPSALLALCPSPPSYLHRILISARRLPLAVVFLLLGLLSPQSLYINPV